MSLWHALTRLDLLKWNRAIPANNLSRCPNSLMIHHDHVGGEGVSGGTICKPKPSCNRRRCKTTISYVSGNRKSQRHHVRLREKSFQIHLSFVAISIFIQPRTNRFVCCCLLLDHHVMMFWFYRIFAVPKLKQFASIRKKCLTDATSVINPSDDGWKNWDENDADGSPWDLKIPSLFPQSNKAK